MRNKKAFTLIEVMVVMAIIAVLAILIIGAIQLARRTATETTHRSNAKTVQTGMEGAYAKQKSYPTYGSATAPVSCASVTEGGTADPLLEVKISDGSSASNACAAGGEAEGGCSIYSAPSSYVIMPYNHDCSATMDDDKLSQ